MVMSGDSFKEASWKKDSRLIEAKLFSEETVLVDADKLKVLLSKKEKK